MTEEKWERTKPHNNPGSIGHVDRGKTAIIAAISSRPGFKLKPEDLPDYPGKCEPKN